MRRMRRRRRRRSRRRRRRRRRWQCRQSKTGEKKEKLVKEREEKTSTSTQEREGTLEKAHLEAFFFIRSFLSLRTAAAHLGPECQSLSLIHPSSFLAAASFASNTLYSIS